MKSWLLCAIACMMFATACAQSDAGITTSVKSQLASDDLVKASSIDVDTQNHIVTLSGEVQSADEKTQALNIARQTRGVSDVVDQLTVASEYRRRPRTSLVLLLRQTPLQPATQRLLRPSRRNCWPTRIRRDCGLTSIQKTAR